MMKTKRFGSVKHFYTSQLEMSGFLVFTNRSIDQREVIVVEDFRICLRTSQKKAGTQFSKLVVE
jgi:hypothetical protein